MEDSTGQQLINAKLYTPPPDRDIASWLLGDLSLFIVLAAPPMGGIVMWRASTVEAMWSPLISIVSLVPVFSARGMFGLVDGSSAPVLQEVVSGSDSSTVLSTSQGLATIAERLWDWKVELSDTLEAVFGSALTCSTTVESDVLDALPTTAAACFVSVAVEAGCSSDSQSSRNDDD